MKEVHVDPMLFDLGNHVVQMNKLMTELNRLSRNSYKPDWTEIDGVATELRHHCSMIQRIVDMVNE
jgi:hypothetical protein